MTCSICKKSTDTLKAGVKDGHYLSERCQRCLDNFAGFADYARKYDRDRQREDYRADIVQPWEPGYAKLYGEENARKHGWTDSDLRKHG